MTDTFESTDDVRSGAPLKHLQSVTFDGPIRLKLGGELPEVVCAYETYGRLNDDASNAVLICHAISGDSHVARHDPDDDPGWWDAMVGPGKPIDTDRYFVICSNVLGGCRGTTGPGTIDPKTGRPYGPTFPDITVEDMVDVQARLLDHLKINRLAAVVGGSLGGHQALCWAMRYPDRIALCCAIATSARLTSQALAFDVVARNAIQTDPDFHAGQYYDKPTKPDTGLAIARMLGHITYLSSKGMADRFDVDRHNPRQIDTEFESKFSVGSYLAYQGQRFVSRFDANSYVTLSLAMDLFDLGQTHEQRVRALSSANCHWLIVSFSSDWLFPPWQSREIVAALTARNQPVTYTEVSTESGHDAFLIERDIRQFGPLVTASIESASADYRPPRLREPLGMIDQRIVELVNPGESVLDLGCGDGRLLAALRDRGAGRLCGVEVKASAIIAAARRGLNVLDYDLNKGLPEFNDHSFDVVVLSATLQAIENIGWLFDEMLRVGNRCIVSFANFAYRDLRRMYAEEGRSPKAEGEYCYEWYDTPNRRFPSIADVHDLLNAKGATIHTAIYLNTHEGRIVPDEDDPNLNADTAILVMSRAST
ncbi:MAG: homoserine O-acetyltransferase [Phycisphaeraceae bacterium]